MPFPLVIWGLGALVAGVAANKGGKAYGDHAVEEARQALIEAEQHVDICQSVFSNIRATYLAEVHENASSIIETCGAHNANFTIEEAKIPEEIQSCWGDIFGRLRSLSSESAAGNFAAQQQAEKVFKTLGIAAHTFPNLGPFTAFFAATYGAHEGVSHALRAASYREKALDHAAAAKIKADAAVQALTDAVFELENNFTHTIIPWMKLSLGPPRDENSIQYLLVATLEFRELARRVLSEPDSE